MTKIPFNIKYRPQIESGEYKIETRAGRPARIVCWDAKGGPDEIVALIKQGNSEAIYRYYRNGSYLSNAEHSLDLFIITPDFTESEDERIRKQLVDIVAFIPEANFSSASREKCRAYLEKQKDASKAIEAVDRIDRYIDENVANAHDMKDSNPDKKYYRGWDDALAEMSRILQDVYSGEKQKEKEPIVPYIDFVIKPHKGDDNNPYDMRVSEAQEYTIKRGFDIPLNDCEVYVDERHMTQTIGNIIRWADEHPKEQKSAEWSEEDNRILEEAIGMIGANGCWVRSDDTVKQVVTFLKSLPERFNLQPNPEWSEEDEKMLEVLISNYKFLSKKYRDEEKDFFCSLSIVRDDLDMGEWLEKRLKFLRPQSHWKPSEEQMEALKNCAYGALRNGDGHVLRELYNDLLKLM